MDKQLEYPPCIQHALAIIDKGENIEHVAKYMLATYMLAIGKTTEETIKIFNNCPDFNDKVVRYNVEHLAGMKGSKTKYHVPSCDMLKREHLCFKIKECDDIINPLQFGDKM